MIIDCVCLSLSDDEEFIFAVWPSSPPLTNSAGAGCVLGRPVGVCSAPTRNTSAHVHTLIDCCATLDIHYNIIHFFSHWYIAIRLRWCAGVCVVCSRKSTENFPPPKKKRREGRASSCQPEQPSYRVGRPLAAADDGGQRRKEKDYRLFSLCTSNKFLTCYNFFLFFFFWLSLVFWLAGVGSFVSQLVRATDKKRKPQKKNYL